MGRPSKLTPEVQARIVQAISGGNFRQVAAEWAGVSAKTLREWMARGAKAKTGPFAEFRAAVLEAERAAEIRMVALVMKAAADDPKHAEWWLERKCPSRWARRDKSPPRNGGPTAIIEHRGAVTSRIADLAAAFEEVACRSGEGSLPGDDSREPLDTE